MTNSLDKMGVLEELLVTGTSVRGAFESQLKVKRQIQLNIEISVQTTDLTYLVIEKLSNPLILGYDFMVRNVVVIISHSQEMKIYPEKI